MFWLKVTLQFYFDYVRLTPIPIPNIGLFSSPLQYNTKLACFMLMKYNFRRTVIFDVVGH